jgi:hypothetical protein
MQSIPRLPFYVSMLLLALAAGCSTTGTGTTGAVVVDGEPDYGGTRTAPAPTAPAVPPPVSGDAPYADLVKRAGDARIAGEYDQALALLERAQRIDPGSADIYLALAETHRARGDLSQARATAERGLLYCGSTAQCDALRAYTR